MTMFDIRVIPDDGEPFDLTAGMRDVRMWEKTHRGRALAQHLSENMKAEYLFELAYSACRRQQLIPRDLSEEVFTDTHEIDLEQPGERAARLRAEKLKSRIEAGEVPPEPEGEADDEGDDDYSRDPAADDLDPTRPGVSPGA